MQVRSPGPSRLPGRPDAIVYPPRPAPLRSFEATILVVITPVSARQSGHLWLRYGGNRNPGSNYRLEPVRNSPGVQAVRFTVPAGPVELMLTPDAGSLYAENTIPMILNPGETREVRLNL